MNYPQDTGSASVVPNDGPSATSLKQISEVAVGGVLVLMVLLVLVVTVKRMRERWLQGPNRGLPIAGRNLAGEDPHAALVRMGGHGTGLDDDIVKGLGPTFEFRISKLGEDSRECAVCLGDYRENDLLRRLDICQHAFHQECIDVWLKSNASCPLCRVSLQPRKDALPQIGPLAREPHDLESQQQRPPGYQLSPASDSGGASGNHPGGDVGSRDLSKEASQLPEAASSSTSGAWSNPRPY